MGDATMGRALVCASRFNESVTRRLADGALAALASAGYERGRVDLVWVAGAWEVPLAIDRGLLSGRYDLAVAVSAIIRGETPHFDVLVAEVTRALGQVTLDRGLPVGFGVLTCDTLEQALARAGGAKGNKGAEAADAACESARLLARLADGDAAP